MSPEDGKRVLLLNHEFPPLGGGAARASFEISRSLVASGHSVVVITSGYGNLPVHGFVDGIEVYRVFGSRRSLLDNRVWVTMVSYLVLGTRLARRLCRERSFDVLHAFFTVPAGLVGLATKRRTHSPLVVSLQGSDVPFHNPDEFRLAIRLLSPVIASVWKRADSVVALSHGQRRTAMRTSPQIAFHMINNGMDTDHFQPALSFPGSGIPQLVCVSRLVHCKGIQDLLVALARLQEEGYAFSLHIAGDGNYRGQLEQLRDRLGLTERVCFLGYVPYQELPALYQRADLFVLPSLTESFGQVFAEAMACGLPVVGTTAGGIPEVVGPEQARWLVPPGDTVALTERLSEAIQSLDELRKLGLRNAAYVRQQFSWAVAAAKYAALYDSLRTDSVHRH